MDNKETSRRDTIRIMLKVLVWGALIFMIGLRIVRKQTASKPEWVDPFSISDAPDSLPQDTFTPLFAPSR